MKQIIVGSQNPVKIEAVRLAFSRVWPNESWDVIGSKTESGVNPQPMSPKESITGARNRAQAALAATTEAEFGVGLEGGLELIGGLWFDCGWIVIVDREGREGIASTARIHTPNAIMQHIHDGKELGDAIDIVFNRINAKQAEGHFGLMTNNAVTRTTGYTEAVCLALSRFLHPELF